MVWLMGEVAWWDSFPLSGGPYFMRAGDLCMGRSLGPQRFKYVNAALEILGLTIQTALINYHKLSA